MSLASLAVALDAAKCPSLAGKATAEQRRDPDKGQCKLREPTLFCQDDPRPCCQMREASLDCAGALAGLCSGDCAVCGGRGRILLIFLDASLSKHKRWAASHAAARKRLARLRTRESIGCNHRQ
eukprot:456193-Pleurochrysis_carterae.AAC.1